MANPYPTDITERERELGFEHIQIENPKAMYGGPPLCTAVARRIAPSSYVFKNASEEDGSIYYKHRCYGVMDDLPTDKPDWLPIGNKTYDDPEMAVYDAESDHDDGHRAYTVLLKLFPPDREQNSPP